MGDKKNNDTTSAFDRIINEIMNEHSGSQMLEECMSFDVELSKKVPLRYRIIALGFVRKYSLEELNSKLKEEGCAQLYSRNLWEASLIFAFLNGMSYREWKSLQEECEEIRTNQEHANIYFNGNGITFQELKKYLNGNSEEDEQKEKRKKNHLMMTRHLTQVLEKKIADLDNDKAEFTSFLSTNLASFSVVREKTRYYFCKYLYFYLENKIENYLSAAQSGIGADIALAELSVLKGLTQLKRKKMSQEDARQFLVDANISCGEIFNAFNYFYFEYVSLDWMEVLMEYYGDITKLPKKEKTKLASALRHYQPEYKKLSDEEIIAKKVEEMSQREDEMDEIYSIYSDGKGYQKNRSGENTVRKFIKGTLDIDRTTLICFLLFFGSDAELPPEYVITKERLSEVLLECGFSGLKEEDDFDYFVIQYLKAPDPVEYLMEEVTRYAVHEENFYLYRMYRSSKSYNDEWINIMGVKKGSKSKKDQQENPDDQKK
ncbi:MAG: hypothetical protein EOM40_15590 [Clostridia bacterium]|nr:hypothetical protein [Clostridia bacterium]NCC42272.1 hypothetical protein [Clostridia bacterium]